MPFDFVHAMKSTGMETKVAERILGRFQKYRKPWFDCIDNSFVTENQKEEYKSLITKRLDTLLKLD